MSSLKSFHFHLSLALVAGMAVSVPVSASPIGTTYRPFLDAPVVDQNSNTATETHRAGPGVIFDGVGEISSQDLILFNGPPPGDAAFVDPPGQVIFDEEETPILGGSLVEFWIMGDDNGSLAPLFTNTIDPNSQDPIVFGVEGLYWVNTFASLGDAAVLVGASFVLTFADGSSVPLTANFADVVFGQGTEDSQFVFFAEFDVADFAGNPTDLHATLEILHIPEPTSALLFVLATVVLPVTCRRRVR